MTFKKTLALTTALSAVALLAANAAVAAEKPKLKIGGYQDTFFGVADTTAGTSNSGTPVFNSSTTDDGAATILAYGEVNFDASGTTDSGMKYGVYFELSIDDGGRNSKPGSTKRDGKFGADEANVWMSGSWGKMEIGNQDGAADKMRTSGLEVDMLGSNILGAFTDVKGSNGIDGADQLNTYEGSDSTKLTYYSPRMSGFQVGISYAPRSSAQGTLGAADGDSKVGGAYEAGVSYTGKAGGAKFKIAATATGNPSEASPGSLTHDGQTIGGAVEINNITVAAGYAQNDNWDVTVKTEQKAWNLGLGYNGGKWSVAAYYLNMKAKDTNTAKFREYSIQAGYNFGGGLTGAIGLYDTDLSSEDSTSVSNNNDAQALIAKLTAKF